MEQVWENLKNDSDKIAGDLEVIVVMDANTEANKEEMNEVTADKKGNASIHIQSVFICYFLVGVSK